MLCISSPGRMTLTLQYETARLDACASGDCVKIINGPTLLEHAWVFLDKKVDFQLIGPENPGV